VNLIQILLISIVTNAHACTLSFFQVDVLNRTAEVDLSNYMPNGEWELLGKPKIVRTIRVREKKKKKMDVRTAFDRSSGWVAQKITDIYSYGAKRDTG
jgi:hypothetical protein